MTDESSPQHSLRSINYLYFSSLYFIAVGVLYLWGYWSTFTINILEYINLADIAKSTAYPIASTYVFFALGVVASEFVGVGRIFPTGGSPNTGISGTLRKYRFTFALIFILGTLAILTFGPIQKWLVVPGLFAIPIAIYMSETNFLAPQIPAERIRSVFTYLLAALPFYAYGYGLMSANKIIHGEQFDYVLSPIDNFPVPLDAEPDQKIRFIGHAGDLLFFWEPKKSIVAITKFEEGKILLLKRFEQKTIAPPKKITPPIEK
ncbi:hypothetical protein [Pseudomonas hormoni]